MSKNFFAILIVAAMILSVSVNAASTRAIMVAPEITFTGTEAKCTARITANNSSDNISATMELWCGNVLIDRWSGNGQWTLKLTKYADVEMNKTYKLVVNYSVNNKVQTPVSISKTNS